MKISVYTLLVSICCMWSAAGLVAQVPAFPGAEGFGSVATGGRGGQVIRVTNLNDDGEGSLRAAIRKKGPRIIVFAVSGTIELQSPLKINNNDVTIAGQSAPGDGICIRNYPVGISADNVVVRFIRFRLGDVQGVEGDAVGGQGNSNLIIDHCSISWATDECASFYDNRNFTLQWCIISEALNHSVHSKGAHGYGGIWGGKGASFHHNLIASNNSRNPRFSGSATTPNTPDERVDFRNNVIFNWGNNSIYGGEKGTYNIVNNYFKPGPATPQNRRKRLVNPSFPFGRFHVAGNYVAGAGHVTADNWNGGVQPDKKAAASLVKEEAAFPVAAVITQPAETAYELVLVYAGASLARDTVDRRVVQEVRSGRLLPGRSGSGIIDSQQEVGGWPVLRSVPPSADSDGDGIPDVWERQHGLDPGESNAAKRTLDPAYDDVEVYLNSLVCHMMGDGSFR